MGGESVLETDIDTFAPLLFPPFFFKCFIKSFRNIYEHKSKSSYLGPVVVWESPSSVDP